MPRTLHVDHAAIRDFAAEKVNIKRDDLTEYRAQANRLRTKLEKHIAANPDYGLIKMRNAGSVAKGTALKTLNDMDLALYVAKAEVPSGETELLNWTAARLREAYPNHPADNIYPGHHAVTISFSGSGLDVDVVPVLYEGEPDDIGYLIVPWTGQRVKTSVTQHLQFIRTRKNRHTFDFAQVVRLGKWWTRRQKNLNSQFRFKSFIVELLCAHLSDTGTDFSDYPTALEEFFSYIVRTELRERVAFDDFYDLGQIPASTGAAMEIYDPVNAENNVAGLYSTSERQAIVTAADEALSAISEASYSTGKGRAVDCWRTILGPSFRV